MAAVIAIAIIFWILIFGFGMYLWTSGTKEENKLKVLFGGFLTLGFIGVLIAMAQSSNWE